MLHDFGREARVKHSPAVAANLLDDALASLRPEDVGGRRPRSAIKDTSVQTGSATQTERNGAFRVKRSVSSSSNSPLHYRARSVSCTFAAFSGASVVRRIVPP